MTTLVQTPPDAAGKDERRLKKVMIGLMRQPEFALFSGVMMCGTTTIRDDIKTAATDGYNIFFGRKFLRLLDEKMIAFVVMHETMHKAFRHLSIYRKLFDIDPSLANCAADYVINLMLVELDPQGKFMTFPVVDGKRLGLLDHRFAGMNTKQVWDILKQEKQKQKGGGKGQPGEGQGEPGEGEGDGDGQPGNGDASGDQNQADGGFDEHLWGEAKTFTKEQQDTQAKELDRALRQGQAAAAKLAGKGSANLNREIGELLDPQVDWKDQLREFVQSTCAAKDASSWRKVNRRFIGQDIYMPSLIGESIREMVVGGDTSGSISDELPVFISEVKAMAEQVRPEKLTMIWWDGAVCRVEHYDMQSLDDFANTTQPKGGGGTRPSCVSEYLKKEGIRPECIIMMTDGYVGSDWGSDWTAPLLWVVAGNPGAQASTGKTIHVNS